MTRRAVLWNPRVRRAVALFLVVWLAGPMALPAQPALCGIAADPPPPPVENRDGYFVNLEEGPVRPLALGSNGNTLWALNLPDARAVVYDITNRFSPQTIGEVGVGLGPVAIVLRPLVAGQQREMWVVCQSSNAVFVIDEANRRVKDTVRLKGEPTGLAFDAAGQFAYVTLAATNQIAKITASAPHSTDPIASGFEFRSETRPGAGQNAHVEEPRSLLVEGDDLYALSFQSGNGSFGNEIDFVTTKVLDGWQTNAAGVTPVPPDRDVLHFDLGTPGSLGTNALWRMGTLNLDLARGGPEGDLYVSTVDFLNATFIDPAGPPIEIRKGEPEYRKKGFAIHAITHAPPGTGAPNAAPARIDLNADIHPALAAAAPSFRCAVPNQMVMASENRMYVACYETKNVAVVDLASDSVIAVLQGGLGANDPFGPRGLALAEDALYVYARGDQRLQVYDVSGLSAGTVRAPVVAATREIGFDITPLRIKNGRRHFLNAANSADGASTCNTCHMDGHLDGIAWDLSDFTGRDDAVPRVPKGTKVTMSLRGIEETPPFHWRGDRSDLAKFNPAFAGLLGGTMLSETADPLDADQLSEFEAFVFSLSYPANPFLGDDRIPTVSARQGFDCFSNHPSVHQVTADSSGATTVLSCAQCHSMAGGSGTLNQVNNPVIGLLADDATQLRGTFDKESDPVAFGGVGVLAILPATGWGFANTGFADSLQQFVSLGAFTFPQPGDSQKVRDFVFQLDTGIAPAAAFAYTVTATGAPEEALLVAQAGASPPHIDLILRGWIRIAPGNDVAFGALWNGTQFVPDRAAIAALAPLTFSELHNRTANRTGKFTLIGTPVGSGYRLALDRDMDFRLDGDESAAPATSIFDPDTDDDLFPDGYETRLAFDPTDPLDTPSELVKPMISAAAVAWTNSNVMRVRWKTNEEAKSRLQIQRVAVPGGPGVLVREFREDQFKMQHTLIARGLEPGAIYRPVILAEDPSGNTRRLTLPDQTMRDHEFLSVHVAATTLVRNGPGAAPGTHNYTATVTLVNEDGGPVGNASAVLKLVEWPSGTCASLCNTETTIDLPAVLSNPANGVLTLTFDGTRSFSGGTAEVFVTPTGPLKAGVADPGKRLYFHPLDGQFGHWARAAVP